MASARSPVGEVTPLGGSPEGRRRVRRPPLVVLAIGIAVALLAALAVEVGSGSGRTTSTTPLGEVSWGEATVLSPEDGYRIGAVSVGEGAVRAVGAAFAAEAWTTTDGTSWATGPLPPEVQRLRLVAGTDLLVGQEGAVSPEPILRPRPFVWRADGPGGWQRADLEPLRTARWWIDRVVAGDGVLLLVGSALDGDRGWLWTSTDRGSSFELVDGLPFRPDRAALATADSGFVAVVADAAHPAAVWASPDGHTWEQAAAPFPAGWRIAAAVAAGDTVVAVGGTPGATQPDSVWRRTPEGSWRDVTGAFDTAAGPVEFATAAAGAAGFAISGTAGGPALWLSRDGTDWQRVDGDVIDGRAGGRSGVGPWVPAAVALGRDRIAVVGRRSAERGDVIWIGEIEAP